MINSLVSLLLEGLLYGRPPPDLADQNDSNLMQQLTAVQSQIQIDSTLNIAATFNDTVVLGPLNDLLGRADIMGGYRGGRGGPDNH